MGASVAVATQFNHRDLGMNQRSNRVNLTFMYVVAVATIYF